MFRYLFALLVVLAVYPATAKEVRVVHIRDPYEKCETVKEETALGLAAHRCGSGGHAVDATLIVHFDLGRSEFAYDRFTIFGGQELSTVSTPSVSVGSCRRGCTFFQTESIVIPFDVLFSQDARTSGLRIKAGGGGWRDQFITVAPDRIERFRLGLIAASFIAETK